MKTIQPTFKRSGAAWRTRRHAGYAALAGGMALVAGYTSVLSVFRGDLQAYLGIGDGRFGLLFSVGSISGIFGVIFLGPLVDRLGPRPVLRFCLAGVGTALLLLAIPGAGFPVFLAAKLLLGLFMGPKAVALAAYLGKLFPRHRRRVVSLNLALGSLGGMIFPLAAEGLLHLARMRPGIRFAAILHGPFLIVALTLLTGSLLLRPRRSAPIRRPRRQAAAPWSWRRFQLPPAALLLAALLALHGASDTALHIWMPRFLESRSFPAVIIPPGLVLSLFATVYLVSRLTLASAPDRIGRRLLLVAPGLAGGTVVILGILSRSQALTVGGYILGALLWSTEFPAILSTLLASQKRNFGAAMAVCGVLSGLGVFTLVGVIGLLVERLGEERMWLAMLIPACGFILVGLGGLYWILRHAGDSPPPTTTPEPQQKGT